MKMAYKISSIFFILSVCIGLTGCYYDTEEELYPDSGSIICDTVSVSYANDIVPIIGSKCSYSGCHSGVNAAAGIPLETYAGIKGFLDTDKALFISSITWDGNASNMPKGSSTKMIDCNINTIKSWINSGYPNN
jgi:uncharacterized membrane protein